MQVGAKECLVSKQDLQINGLKMVLERSNILVTETAKGINANYFVGLRAVCQIKVFFTLFASVLFFFLAEFNSSNIVQDLNRLVKKANENENISTLGMEIFFFVIFLSILCSYFSIFDCACNYIFFVSS